MKLILVVCLAAATAAAQNPVVGIIDFYGFREVSETRAREVLGVSEGGELPSSRIDAEEALEQIPGVVRARILATCCEDGEAILYVGIEEKGAPHFDFRDPPSELVVLPEEVHDTYVHFVAALEEAVRLNETAEDFTNGHSLMANAACRVYQERFVELATAHLDILRDVLRNSYNEEHRAMAAYIIGYAPGKREVVNDLMYALRDPDETVRDNAMRALAAIEVLARLRPTLDIEIPPTWLIEMLNSLIWTDRTAAAVNLVNLTENRDAAALAQLRDRALPALVDMASWKSLPHALPGFILLGRALGVEEEAIQKAWSDGNREELISRARDAVAAAAKGN